MLKVLEGKCNWTVLVNDDFDCVFPEWVKVKRYKKEFNDNVANRFLNRFISEGLEPKTQYFTLNDDDSVEEGFFDKIPNADVIIVSAQRTDREQKHIVWDDWKNKIGHFRYGIDTLLACPENMKIGRVGGSQLIIKGKVWRNFRNGLNPEGDGEMILKIAEEYPITYLPDAFLYFNYLEDGRWDKFVRYPNIVVYTPFYRTENFPYLVSMLKGKVRWVVLVDSKDDAVFPEWVEVRRYEKPPEITNNRYDSMSCYWMMNKFIEDGLDDETQYLCLSDDDAVGSDFFGQIPDKDLVIVTLNRGDKLSDKDLQLRFNNGMIVDGLIFDQSSPVLAVESNAKRFQTQQMIIKGKLLKKYKFGLNSHADGELIEKIIKENEPVYLKDTVVLFNYFEDGRYSMFQRPKVKRKHPVALFVGDYFRGANVKSGLSEWEGGIWQSLESTGLADVARFHYDKFYLVTGSNGDNTFIKRFNEIKPDFVVIVLYKPPSLADRSIVSVEVLDYIHRSGTPIVAIWGDPQSFEQRWLSSSLERLIKHNYVTGSESLCKQMGYKYMHVPKDQRIFNNPNLERKQDVVFVGTYQGREYRMKTLKFLIDNKVNLFYGGSECYDHLSTEDYAEKYKTAKIALSFNNLPNANLTNARVFEVMSCGALLMEQKSEETEKLYIPGVDYVEWTDEIDLLNKIKYYLEHEDERKKIADSGHKKTIELYSAKTFWNEALKGII